MAIFDPSSYGERIAALLREDRLNELGPGRPNQAVRSDLDALTLVSAFAGCENPSVRGIRRTRSARISSPFSRSYSCRPFGIRGWILERPMFRHRQSFHGSASHAGEAGGR